MEKKIQVDIFGITPELDDTIVYNPPFYKGLVHGKCVGFTKAGLPEIEFEDKDKFYGGLPNANGYHTPKTGFVVYK